MNAKLATAFLIASVLGHSSISEEDDRLLDSEDEALAEQRTEAVKRIWSEVDAFNAERLADPAARERAKELFASFYESLTSPEGMELTRELRDTVGFRITPKVEDPEVQKVREGAIVEVRKELTDLLIRNAEEKEIEVNEHTKDFLAGL